MLAPTNHRYQLFVGIDIAATTFAASWTTEGPPHERARTFPQTPAGFAALQEQLDATGIVPAHTLVVVEATGSYWIALAVALHQAGYVVSVVNPAQAHNYAKSLPRRGKTDALDAHVLAQFAAERKPPPWTPPPQVYTNCGSDW
jgi:transposase